MNSSTQPTDFVDLYTLLMNEVLSDTGNTVTVTQAKRAINIALHDIHIGFGEKFPWAERQAVLQTQPKYTTGTVSVSSGSTALVGVGTLFATAGSYGENNAIVGGKMTIAGGTEVYELTAIADDTNATLGSRYIPTSDASGSNYVYFQDDYALASDFLHPIDQRRFSNGATAIELISRTDFRRRYPTNRIPGVSRVATLVERTFGASTTRQRRLRLAPPSSKAMAIAYSYVTSNLAVDASGNELTQMSTDSDEPIVPLQYRYAIVLHALSSWYRKKDDARSKEVKAEYTELVLRMVGDHEIGEVRPRIQPITGPYRRRARSPWRGGSGRRFDVNGAFDRLEDVR